MTEICAFKPCSAPADRYVVLQGPKNVAYFWAYACEAHVTTIMAVATQRWRTYIRTGHFTVLQRQLGIAYDADWQPLPAESET